MKLWVSHLLGVTLSVFFANNVDAGVNHWTTTGPAGRSVAAVAIDPKSPATLYAGTDQGIFKTTNKGANWTALSLSFTAEIKAVAIDPTNPVILYASYIKGTTSFGVLKSTDGGISWTEVNVPPRCTTAFAFIVAPTVPASVYVTCDDFNTGFSFVLKSVNGGGTWTPLDALPNGRVETFVVDPGTPTTVYAVMDSGLFKSTDSGTQWTRVTIGEQPNRAFTIAPTTPSTLYVDGTFRSIDGGVTWEGVGLPNFIAPPMIVDPLRPTTLYSSSGVGGVVYSTDGGKSWASLDDLGSPATALVIDPATGSTLYAVTSREPLFDGTPAGLVLALQVVDPLPLPIFAAFESPEEDQPVSGIGVVRGWAFPTRSDHTLNSTLEFVVDGGKGGLYFRSLSCCSERLDVQAAFPQFPAAQTSQSGWGGLFNWGTLPAGSHTLRVALSSRGSIGYPSQLAPPFRTVTVVKPGDFEFLDRFDLGQTQANISGNELALTGVVVRDVFSYQQKRINVHFRWFTNLQSLGMVRSETVDTVASWRSDLSRMLTTVASHMWRGVGVVAPVQAASVTASNWESPNEGQAVSGIGILRGWAFADEPPFNPRRPLPSVQDVVVRVEGALIAKVFCCAERDDVMVAFPDHENAFQSGWALQFNYGNLSEGSHTISVQLHPASENVPSETFERTVQVIRVGGFSFIDQFDLAGATARIEGEEIVLSSVQVRDKASQQTKVIDVRYQWFTNQQSLGLVNSETVAALSSVPSPFTTLLAAVARRLWKTPDLIPSAQAAQSIFSNFESPNEGQIASGIGILRGWSFAEVPPDQVGRHRIPSAPPLHLLVDGKEHDRIACCADRDDVAAAFPDKAPAILSGWAMQLNYGEFDPGEHTLSVELQSWDGVRQTLTRRITTIRIGGFRFLDQFDLTAATARIEGEEIVLSGVQVRDKASQQTKVIAVRLRWFQHSQSLGIVASSM